MLFVIMRHLLLCCVLLLQTGDQAMTVAHHMVCIDCCTSPHWHYRSKIAWNAISIPCTAIIDGATDAVVISSTISVGHVKHVLTAHNGPDKPSLGNGDQQGTAHWHTVWVCTQPISSD